MTDPALGSVLRRPAVFLDRDGTLTEPRHYPSRPEELVLQSGIGPPLLALQRHGFALIVVTNQSGVARGLVDEAAIAPMHRRLSELLARHRVRPDGIYHCPHHPDGVVPRFSVACSCRKPAPGMLHQAAGDLGCDLTASWMVGDSVCDIDAGHRAGTRTALVGPQPFTAVVPTLYRTTTAQALTAIAACEIPESSSGQGTGRPATDCSAASSQGDSCASGQDGDVHEIAPKRSRITGRVM
ncbi:D-glycero-alpha-D-manno-heptose-1,7-bisphosphate 7-phosphatase [Streptomyces violascens]|uniref:D-glycero-alpha-D-manno-heptose-1,7-bisphosphate 7-phosphatase n=1 Tax=Streptomyces violascens TaxID=67381 RepID=UPI003797BFCC